MEDIINDELAPRCLIIYAVEIYSAQGHQCKQNNNKQSDVRFSPPTQHRHMAFGPSPEPPSSKLRPLPLLWLRLGWDPPWWPCVCVRGKHMGWATLSINLLVVTARHRLPQRARACFSPFSSFFFVRVLCHRWASIGCWDLRLRRRGLSGVSSHPQAAGNIKQKSTQEALYEGNDN